MILFGNSLNAAVRKVLCCAALRVIDIEQISLIKGSDDPIFRACSPAGIIPALRHDDQNLTGALAIIDYLDGIGTEEPMIPRDRRMRSNAFSVAQIADGPLAQVASAIFQNSIFLPRFLGKPGNTQLTNRLLKGPMVRALEATEASLGRSSPSALGRSCGGVGFAEVAVFCQGMALMLSGQAISADRYPRVHALMRRVLVEPRLAPLVAREARLVGSEAQKLANLLGLVPTPELA